MEAKLSSAGNSDLNRKDLAAAIHSALGVDAMWPDGSAVSGVHGQLRGLEGVGSTTVGAATFGLFAFRVSHDERRWVCCEIAWPADGNRPRVFE